jgi:hypothetical protein
MSDQTITKMYDDCATAKAVVAELEAKGVPDRHISIIANDPDHVDTKGEHVAKDAGIGAGAGAALGGGAGLLAGLGMMAIPGVGPVVAAGWLVATLAGAAAGGAAGAAAGGIIGALTAHGISEEEAHVYAEGVRRGGALVSVKTDDKWIGVAREVMDRHRFVDPTIRGAAYRAAGWSSFDETTPPYTPVEIQKERDLYRS